MQMQKDKTFKCKKARLCSVQKPVSPLGWILSNCTNYFILLQYNSTSALSWVVSMVLKLSGVMGI